MMSTSETSPPGALFLSKKLMFDLKVINSVLSELEEERNIPREKVIEAIETALATAYKKEYGKRGQVIRAKFDIASGVTEFYQVKFVVDETCVRMPEDTDDTDIDEEPATSETEDNEIDDRPRFDQEKHILLSDARLIKKDAEVDDELIFPLEAHEDFGRIAAQTAKQVIIQKIREAEKISILREYEHREGEIVTGTVERIERGSVYLNLGRVPAVLAREEQIPGEHFRQGERVRAYLFAVEENPRGVFLRISRTHPKFLQKLFALETPELQSGAMEIKGIAREAGSRSKIAVRAVDPHLDPVGALVGQRGVRVSTVMSELGGEKIDIIEWSDKPEELVEDALSPAKVLKVEIDEVQHLATAEVEEDQLSLAIGRAGQNVRLAAKLTGWRIDIHAHGSHGGSEELAESHESDVGDSEDGAGMEQVEKNDELDTEHTDTKKADTDNSEEDTKAD